MSKDITRRLIGKCPLKKQRKVGSVAAQHKGHQIKELITNLLATKGLFPSPNDIDTLLVNIIHFVAGVGTIG